jgi:tRNA A37 methylthiotransferase MiaB
MFRANIILRFPREKEQTSQDRLRLLNSIDLAFADVLKYSARGKKKTASMSEQITKKINEA